MKRIVLVTLPVLVNLAEMQQALEISSHFKQSDHVHQLVIYDELRERHLHRKEKPAEPRVVETVIKLEVVLKPQEIQDCNFDLPPPIEVTSSNEKFSK